MSQSRTDAGGSYSAIEVRSYLPPGWMLETEEGRSEPGGWSIDVQDVSELVSTLVVPDREADRLGRIPALRAAIDRLVRKA